MTNRKKRRDAEMTELSDNDLITQLYKCYKHAQVRDCRNEKNKTKNKRPNRIFMVYKKTILSINTQVTNKMTEN